MFDLEPSIADWRQQMLAAGIQTPVPLEELESHLREDIARQMKSGLNEQKAFEVSVQRIGQPQTIKREFKKVERKQMKRILIISAGVVGILVGMAFVMPAVAQYRHEGAMTLNEIDLLLLGFGLSLGGGSVAVFTFKKRRA
ncbi:MAG TPA: permease prefix domain 1-containing protein [Verrucomicrobiae bacterium]|nr:permease prefix domain 1-containing protein [Verrucomicrobiae bacterium]